MCVWEGGGGLQQSVDQVTQVGDQGTASYITGQRHGTTQTRLSLEINACISGDKRLSPEMNAFISGDNCICLQR